MTRETFLLHIFYVIVMLIGCLTVYILSKNPINVDKIDYLISFIIPLWSAIAYMSIAIGQGYLKINNEVIYYARYLDWIVTTPLLLISLALTGMYTVKKDKAIILSLVFSDVIMILCGLIGDLSSDNKIFLWFIIGTIAFLWILYLIWVPLKNIAKSQSPQLYKLYRFLCTYLTIFWIAYPTSWIIGPSGLGLVDQRIDTYLFIFLPIFSKVGFSILDLIGLRKLNNNLNY